MIKVLLVGSRPMSLAGLRALIDDEDNMRVVGERAYAKNGVAPPLDSTPDIAVIDHAENESPESLTDLGRDAGGAPQCIVVTACTAHCYRKSFVWALVALSSLTSRPLS